MVQDRAKIEQVSGPHCKSTQESFALFSPEIFYFDVGRFWTGTGSWFMTYPDLWSQLTKFSKAVTAMSTMVYAGMYRDRRQDVAVEMERN